MTATTLKATSTSSTRVPAAPTQSPLNSTPSLVSLLCHGMTINYPTMLPPVATTSRFAVPAWNGSIPCACSACTPTPKVPATRSTHKNLPSPPSPPMSIRTRSILQQALAVLDATDDGSSLGSHEDDSYDDDDEYEYASN